MSSHLTKLGLLSLISAAAAVPHGHAARHFHPSGRPSGAPWWAANSTGLYAPTGTGDDTTSEVTETRYSTETLVSTVYVKPVPASSAGLLSESIVAAQVSQVSGQCGAQETVYVTATNKVTVTVTPGAGSAVPAPSSTGSESSAPLSSSAVAAESIASILNHGYGSSAAAPSSLAVFSSAAAPSSYAVPVSSAVEASSVAVSSAAASSVAASSAVASSAKPSSTSTPSYSGGKRGIPYNDAANLQCFADVGKVSWAYSWGQDATGVPSGMEFIPMLWGPASEFTNSWESNWKKFLSSGTKTFFAFNEADLSSQANLSPSEGAEAFKTWMNPIKEADSSVQIGTPSVTNGANGQGLDWTESFISACGGGCSYDFVNIHWYESPDQVEYFKSHVTEAHTRFGLPVWISEMGFTSTDSSAIDSFLKEVLPWLDEQDFVVRYAMFMAKSGPGLLNDGTEKSQVGTTYATA